MCASIFFLYFTILIPSIQVTDKEFHCKFLVIPQLEFDGEFPSDRFDIDDEDLDLDCYCGHLSVNFAKELMEKGSFKTAHPGRVRLDANVDLPPFTNGVVCVKQVYEK